MYPWHRHSISHQGVHRSSGPASLATPPTIGDLALSIEERFMLATVLEVSPSLPKNRKYEENQIIDCVTCCLVIILLQFSRTLLPAAMMSLIPTRFSANSNAHRTLLTRSSKEKDELLENFSVQSKSRQPNNPFMIRSSILEVTKRLPFPQTIIRSAAFSSSNPALKTTEMVKH